MGQEAHEYGHQATPMRFPFSASAKQGAHWLMSAKQSTSQSPAGWLELHDSGTFVRFTQSGADLFA